MSDFRAWTFDLREVSVPVRLACTDGATIDRTLSVQPESDGYTFWPPVIGGAVDEMYLSSPGARTRGQRDDVGDVRP